MHAPLPFSPRIVLSEAVGAFPAAARPRPPRPHLARAQSLVENGVEPRNDGVGRLPPTPTRAHTHTQTHTRPHTHTHIRTHTAAKQGRR